MLIFETAVPPDVAAQAPPLDQWLLHSGPDGEHVADRRARHARPGAQLRHQRGDGIGGIALFAGVGRPKNRS